MMPDPALADMDVDTLAATAKMTASCLDADLDIDPGALADLLRELVSRLEAPDA